VSSLKKTFSVFLAAVIFVPMGASPVSSQHNSTAANESVTAKNPTPENNSQWYDDVRDSILEEYANNDPVDNDPAQTAENEKRRRLLGGIFFFGASFGGLMGALFGRSSNGCKSKIQPRCNIQSPSQ